MQYILDRGMVLGKFILPLLLLQPNLCVFSNAILESHLRKDGILQIMCGNLSRSAFSRVCSWLVWAGLLAPQFPKSVLRSVCLLSHALVGKTSLGPLAPWYIVLGFTRVLLFVDGCLIHCLKRRTKKKECLMPLWCFYLPFDIFIDQSTLVFQECIV